MKIVRDIYRYTVPEKVRKYIYFLREPSNRRKLRKKILSSLEALEEPDEEIMEIHTYLQTHRLSVFPYSFAEKYSYQDITIYQDSDNYFYLIHNGKRLYAPQTWGKERFAAYYAGLQIEQDVASPHRYLLEGRYPPVGSIIADVGAAEGIFSLDVVELAKKIYLFESDLQWISALQKTFAPWKEKVEIIQKFVGSKTNNECITLDGFFADKEVDFLKADIEGAEEEMLLGGEETFSKKLQKVLMCMYHRAKDEQMINSYLHAKGFSTTVNKGYIIFLHDPMLQPPYIRRGVVYGEKHILN